MSLNLKLREGVVGVFTNSSGQVLVGERTKEAGAWQFPQGGVDAGEDYDIALMREMAEELGTERFIVLSKADHLISYLFPPDLKSRIVKEYAGQLHQWYLLQFVGQAGPKLASSDGEFSNFKWVTPEAAVADVIPWKRPAYQEGLELLGILKSSPRGH